MKSLSIRVSCVCINRLIFYLSQLIVLIFLYCLGMDKEEENGKISKFTFEERQNLRGFFSILLKVDKRANPQYYKLKNSENNESDNSSQSVG